MKPNNFFHNEELEVNLKTLSGDISILRVKKLSQENISKKRNDTPVLTELWLFWLKFGIKYELTFPKW